MPKARRFSGRQGEWDLHDLYQRVKALETMQLPPAGFPMPYGNYFANAATSIPDGTYTEIPLSLTDEGYGMALSSGQVEVPITGVYYVDWGVAFASASSGGGFSALYQNGAEVAQGSSVGFSGDPARQSVGSQLVPCSAGDLLGLYAYQNSGSALDIESGANRSWLEAILLGPQ